MYGFSVTRGSDRPLSKDFLRPLGTALRQVYTPNSSGFSSASIRAKFAFWISSERPACVKAAVCHDFCGVIAIEPNSGCQAIGGGKDISANNPFHYIWIRSYTFYKTIYRYAL